MVIWFLFGAMCMLVVLLMLAYVKFVALNKAAAGQQYEKPRGIDSQPGAFRRFF